MVQKKPDSHILLDKQKDQALEKKPTKDFFETQDFSSPNTPLQKLFSTYGLEIFPLPVKGQDRHGLTSADSAETESDPKFQFESFL